MRLTTLICYAPEEDDMNIGAEYNRLVQDSGTEWVCFLDHDALWLRSDWAKHITQAIQDIPRLGLLTCPTNRIGQPFQQWNDGEYRNSHDIKHLRKQAKRLPYQTTQIPDTALTSGVVMVTSKTAHARAGGFSEGFLGVDNNYHERILKAGLEAHMLSSQPVYHWYRGDRNMRHYHKSIELHPPIAPERG